MQQLLMVGLGGFLGAVARYTLTGMVNGFVIHRFGRSYPAGTFAVNILGCFIIGCLMALVLQRQLPETLRLLLITGFLGSLTTFSTFGYETAELLRETELRLACWNIAANLLVGLAAVYSGLWVGKLFSGL